MCWKDKPRRQRAATSLPQHTEMVATAATTTAAAAAAVVGAPDAFPPRVLGQFIFYFYFFYSTNSFFLHLD